MGHHILVLAGPIWLGEAGPGPSYLAQMLKSAGGFPAHGNSRAQWDAGARFDFENPEYRA